MLVADGEVFWKSPNVFDVAGAVGLFVGLVSIWLSWWLAKRDIKKRLDEASERASAAARDEVRRVADAVLQTGLRDVIRALDLAREACRGERWERAAELCVQTGELLARVLGQPRLTDELRIELETVSASLTGCVARLRRLRSETAKLPPIVAREVDDSLLTLHRIEGTMTGIRPEVDRG